MFAKLPKKNRTASVFTQLAITCSKLTVKTVERDQWRRSGVFNVNFEHISHLVLVFLLLTLRG